MKPCFTKPGDFVLSKNLICLLQITRKIIGVREWFLCFYLFCLYRSICFENFKISVNLKLCNRLVYYYSNILIMWSLLRKNCIILIHNQVLSLQRFNRTKILINNPFQDNDFMVCLNVILWYEAQFVMAKQKNLVFLGSHSKICHNGLKVVCSDLFMCVQKKD